MVLNSRSSIGHNLMCIFYHDPKLPAHYQRLMKLRLDETFYYTCTFTDPRNLTAYVRHRFIVNRLVLIISGEKAQFLCDIMGKSKRIPHNSFLYEFQFDKNKLKSELSADKKFHSIDELFKKITDDVKQFTNKENQYPQMVVDNDETILQQSTLSFGIHEKPKNQQSFSYLSTQALKFILFQSFIEVLLGIPIDKDAIRHMWVRCRGDTANQDNDNYLKQVDEFEDTYSSTDAIRFYSKDSFLFRSVNKALRCENIERIFTFHPFISHLHQQLLKLGSEQRCTGNCLQTVLHRGKKLPASVLQQLQDNTDHLISINSFLSTTKNDNVANMFADNVNMRSGYETVILEMHLDDTSLEKMMQMKRPCADITNQCENPDEEEVLFFMGFVWCIKSVNQAPENHWKVELELSTDMNVHMANNFNELKGECTYFTLGKILHELGEYTDAINFYERMLESASNLSSKTRAEIHFHIGISAFANNLYKFAIDNLREAEQLMEKAARPSDGISTTFRPAYAEDNELTPMRILTNIGLVYQKMNNETNAYDSFDKALKRDGSTIDKAKLCYYIGVLQFECRKYEDARFYYHQAYDLAEDEELKIEINQRLDKLENTAVNT
ncbi:unnamed protein product [Rotaria socialis]